MINDRGLKKWQGFFMPEHITTVKEEFENEKKIKRPILDEMKIADMETTILEGMEYAWIMRFKIYKDGYIETLIGRTHVLEYQKKEVRILDEDTKKFCYVPFADLLDVERF